LVDQFLLQVIGMFDPLLFPMILLLILMVGILKATVEARGVNGWPSILFRRPVTTEGGIGLIQIFAVDNGEPVTLFSHEGMEYDPAEVEKQFLAAVTKGINSGCEINNAPLYPPELNRRGGGMID
jgi:hypothetical protein